MMLQQRFDRMSVAIDQNPAGFRVSQTGKRRFARLGPNISPYEQLAAQVYGEPLKPEFSIRGEAKRVARAAANARVAEARPARYRHGFAKYPAHKGDVMQERMAA